MNPPERTKWIGFLKLRDALGLPGCAVCRLVLDSSRHMLGGLFHEFVNDPTTRGRLQAANGFCNWHAWMAVQMPESGSGLATIYETILDSVLSRFDAIDRRPDTNAFTRRILGSERSGLSILLERTDDCQICVRATEAEDGYLHELITWFDDDELRAAFDQSFGLCLVHLDLVMTRFQGHKNLKVLAEAERKKCERLLEELKDYLRKLDFQNANEPRGQEQDSWRRVVELLAGKARVFDRQLRRNK